MIYSVFKFCKVHKNLEYVINRNQVKTQFVVEKIII